jgi:hypothetical protein
VCYLLLKIFYVENRELSQVLFARRIPYFFRACQDILIQITPGGVLSMIFPGAGTWQKIRLKKLLGAASFLQ